MATSASLPLETAEQNGLDVRTKEEPGNTCERGPLEGLRRSTTESPSRKRTDRYFIRGHGAGAPSPALPGQRQDFYLRSMTDVRVYTVTDLLGPRPAHSV